MADEKKKKPAKPKKSFKLDQKTKNTCIFGGLAIVLIIVAFVIGINTANNKIKYVSNYGDGIKTSITLDTKNFEATLNVEIQGQKISQTGTYISTDKQTSDVSSNTTSNVENIPSHYELTIQSKDKTDIIKMTILNDELTLIYEDGTKVIYHKE